MRALKSLSFNPEKKSYYFFLLGPKGLYRVKPETQNPTKEKIHPELLLRCEKHYHLVTSALFGDPSFLSTSLHALSKKKKKKKKEESFPLA